jgi:hypothetical protein
VLLRTWLRDLGRVVPTLHELGGVAGDAWRPEHEGAWAAGFEVVSGAMLEGAAATAPALPQAA